MPTPYCVTEGPYNLTPTGFDVVGRITDDGGLPCSLYVDPEPWWVMKESYHRIGTDLHTGDYVQTHHTAYWNTRRITMSHGVINPDDDSDSEKVKFFLPTERGPTDGLLWTVLSYTGVCSQGYYLFRCTTDTPCTMTAHWSHLAPDYKQIPHTKRGVTTWHDRAIAFHTSRTTAQMESYDSIEHTFKIPFLQKGKLYYWYLTGTTEGNESPSTSPLFSARCTAPPPGTIYYPQTAGKFVEGYGKDFPTQWGKHDADNWNNSGINQAYYYQSTGSAYSYCHFVRTYFVFDTRSLSPGANIKHAWVHTRCNVKVMNPYEDTVYLLATNPPAPHDPIVKGDFYQGNFAEILGMIPTSEITVGQWFDMDILPGKLGCINPGGYTNLGWRQGADVHGVNLCPLPGQTQQRSIAVYGTSPNRPELHVIVG